MKTHTRRRILETAIDLFAKRGFDSVSIRDIAKKLKIKGSSIYNHFRSKKCLLEAILSYANSEISESREPGNTAEELAGHYPPEVFFEKITRPYSQYMDNPVLMKIGHFFAIEQFHNKKIRAMLKQELVDVPRSYFEKFFKTMADKKIIKPYDPKMLALLCLSFSIYLYETQFVLKHDRKLSIREVERERKPFNKFLWNLIKSQ